MARIAGVDIPREKRVEIGLTYIFGIGRTASNEILTKTGVNPDTRVKDLTDAHDAEGGLRGGRRLSVCHRLCPQYAQGFL